MSLHVCIDWGNTRVKAAVFQNDEIIKSFNFSEQEAIGGIESILTEFRPHKSILSSVVYHPEALEELLQINTQYVRFTAESQLPIMNAYYSAETLGLDRVALVVGANCEFPDNNNLVISVGTAITYNFILSNGAFRGGNITPGVELRFKALHEHTDKLPLVSRDGDLVLLGYDTESNIRAGVIYGIAAEIDGMMSFYREQYGDVNVFLTGGDAPLFSDKLKNKALTDMQLLLKGLNIILKKNAS